MQKKLTNTQTTAIFMFVLSLAFGVYTAAWASNSLPTKFDPIHESRRHIVDIIYMFYALCYVFLLLISVFKLLIQKPLAQADVLDEEINRNN